MPDRYLVSTGNSLANFREVVASSHEAAAREAARMASVGGLRKGVQMRVVPIADEKVFEVSYDDPDWSWYPRERGPLSPPIHVVVKELS